MTNILAIFGSPRGEFSYSTKLAKHLLDRLNEKLQDANIDVINFSEQSINHLDGFSIEAMFTPEDERTDLQRSRFINQQNEYIEKLNKADILVISTAMINFSISSQLKSWIDNITVAGKTFKYTENGPVGLLANKKAYILVASGGQYDEGSPLNFVNPYLKTMLDFIGITEQTFIMAGGMSLGEEKVKQSLDKAKEQIDSLII